jgi:ArsR family transcriptional regulator
MNNIKNCAKILKSFSDENRLRITFMLLNRPLCVCEINEILDIALSTISAHLKNMKYNGIIEDTKEGRWVIYKLVDNENIINLINFLYDKVKDDPVVLNDKRKLLTLERQNLMCR